MSADPTEPETFEPDGPEIERDDETPEADAAEQHAEVGSENDEPLTHIDQDKASEGDAAEQARSVSLDEDEYR